MSEIEVKALEWNSYRAETPFGYYHIDDQTDRSPDELKGREPFLLTGSRIDFARFATLEAAKAAAQSDYDARIRSALVSIPPAAPTITQEMVDAFRMDQAQGRSLQSSLAAALSASPSPVDGRELIERLVKATEHLNPEVEIVALHDPEYGDVTDCSTTVADFRAALASGDRNG